MRRVLAVPLLALVLAGTAAAAPVRDAADPLGADEWWLVHIGADRAAPPGPGVPITIVDSGVDPSHEEFAGRPNTIFLNDQSVVGPDEYHGTIVASLAAAPENGRGIVGVYPQAVLQVWDASTGFRGISDRSAIAGILAAAAHCPGVINLSFGSIDPDPMLDEAVLTAVDHGCLVVAASGNLGDVGSPATYPSAWPHVLTVGATDAADVVADFSTIGPYLDLVAPGEGVTGAVPLSKDPSGYSGGLDGTSFAAPIVAAAAAWIWTVRPELSVSQLGELLRRSARDLDRPGFDFETGWGLLDLPAALTAPTPPADPGEPNDDVEQVRGGLLFEVGKPPLTTPARPSIRISGTVDATEDPHDVYRIWVPPGRTVRVGIAASGRAVARIWGPRTRTVGERGTERRRDLLGSEARAGARGFSAYVEVLPARRVGNARYTLSVRAARH